jgi:hypothetical protein
MSSSERDPQSFKTTAQILAYIHKCYVEKQLEKDLDSSSVEWDCVLEEGEYYEDWEVELNEWALFPHIWSALNFS